MAAPQPQKMLAKLIAGLSLLALASALSACSAIELREQMATTTAAAAGPAGPQATIAAWEATAETLAEEAAAASATLSAFKTATRPSPEPVAAANFAPVTAMEATVFGNVPLDSDRLNTIAALALDQAGNLLAATRAGEVYRLSDSDADGSADQRELVFADDEERLRQVAGMVMRGDSLILLHSGKVSQLQDSDGDGGYDSLIHLTEDLPLPETTLLAGAGLVQAADGSLFSANLGTGEIILIQTGQSGD